ncbi:saframycin Mx1 synthetase B [Legionella beliardensis]|uniref:Saframycin Mx1 synthetase B n=1 Tax=Legionella beliardensis TaxID=91822 RepID=A0A378HZN4_9GAMM|nr:aminotransferase class I/II-fold pyridoxal phosphate-dependent enzyme [Legionella beliardensis]STX27971.1 saframycin Mx1 synthetase B [Legionella beliardensis]
MSSGFIDTFYKIAYQHPQKSIFTYLDEENAENTISYGQLDYKARQIATLLKLISSVPGDTVLVMFPPGLDFIYSFLGCAYAQKVIVPVMPPVSVEAANKLKLIIDNAKPIACITTKTIYERLKKLKLVNSLVKKPILGSLITKFSSNLLNKFEPLMATDLFSLHWLTTDSLSNSTSADLFNLPTMNPQAPLFLQYTSGSTGNPKGVIVTHQSVLHNIQAIKYGLDIREKDILYSWLPQYHDMGLIGCILTPLYTGLYTIIDSPFKFLTNPISWLQGINKYQCTISAAPNFAYELCANKVTVDEKKALDLRSWRVAVNSAEPIRASTIKKFYDVFKECGFKQETFYPSYGLAEATLFVTTKSVSSRFHSVILDKYALQLGEVKLVEPADQSAQHFISSGDIDSNIESHHIVVVEPNNHIPLSEQKVGEIWISSPSVNPGYWKQDQESLNIFQAKLVGKKTYLKTGDLGFIKDGQLYITGRIKDLIIIRGKNYYPQDIEYTVEQADRNIRAGCINAFAIEQNDHEALVILAEIKIKTKYQEITKRITEAVFKHHGIMPFSVVLLAPKVLKKTTSGKVRRKEMKKRYLAGELPLLFTWQQDGSQTITEPSQTNRLISNVNDNLSLMVIKTITDTLRSTEQQEVLITKKLTELGFDSLLMAELISSLKSQLPVSVELSVQYIIENNPTVKELINYIKNQSSEIVALDTHQKSHQSRKVYTASEQQHWMDIKNLPDYKKLKYSQDLLGEQNVSKLYFNSVKGISDNLVDLEGEKYINFSGYNYLGYAGDKRVIAKTNEAINRYGTSVSASRLISGQKPIHCELEEELAAFIGTEDAVVFTAGHATNVSVITHLYNAEDIIFHDSLIHNSSLQGAIFSKAKRISFPHNDFNALEKLMKKERHYYRRALILIEGVYSMDGDIPNVPEFIKIKNQNNAHLMIDEAHSIGTIGKTGRGIREYFDLNADDVELWMGTLSKAFASCGGYIAGKSSMIDYIKRSCGGFVFSAGMTPANAAAALTSIRLLKQESFRPLKLQQCAANLLMYLKQYKINTGNSYNTPIIPIIVGDENKAIDLCLKLRNHKIYTIPIIYPAVDKGQARIRLFINYMHTEEQIAYTANIIHQNLN